MSLSLSNKRKASGEIEYAPPPNEEDPNLKLKVKLLQELKQNQERHLEILLPFKEELEQLKQKCLDLKEQLKAVNLDIQMKKLQDMQDKLMSKLK